MDKQETPAEKFNREYMAGTLVPEPLLSEMLGDEPADLSGMDADEIQERQGWNDDTMLDIAMQYIRNQGDDAAWNDFVRGIADTENGQ